MTEVGAKRLEVSENLLIRKCFKGNWNTARSVVTHEEARAFTLPFHHFKAPDKDSIYLATLKHVLLWAICLLLDRRFVFIPKLLKDDY